MKQREYITVRKDQKEYQQLINGSAFDGRLVLPVESFSVASQSEWATFELIPFETPMRPARVYVILKGIRPRYLSMTLIAPFLCLVQFWGSFQPSNGVLVGSTLVSLMLLHFSIFLFNDYKDHFKGDGLTRATKKLGIIQRGWATANEVRLWAFVNFGLGAAFAAPAFYARPLFVLGMGAIVSLTFVIVSQIHSRLGEFGLNEFMVSLSLGPMLAYGFSYTIFGSVSVFVLSVSILFGWLSSLVFQSKYLEEMVNTYQNRRKTLIGRLGFDRAKLFIQIQLVAQPLMALSLLFFFDRPVVIGLLSLGLASISVVVISKIQMAPSPMSSSLRNLSQTLCWSHMALSLITLLALVLF